MNSKTKNSTFEAAITDLDYLVWALATVHLQQSHEYVSPQFAPAQWRGRVIATAAKKMKGFAKLELLSLVLFSAHMGADCRLVARPYAPKLQARVTHISQAAKLSVRDGISPTVKCIGSWLDSVRDTVPVDEVAWSSQIAEKTVKKILQGHKTRIDLIARVMEAMGYKLRFWLAYDGCAVGDAEFCRRFPYAARSAYKRSVRKKLRQRVSNADFLSLLISDIG